MTRCPYRADKECNTIQKRIQENGLKYCIVCLHGQQADELSLLNSSIANLTASIEERLCREEQK